MNFWKKIISQISQIFFQDKKEREKEEKNVIENIPKNTFAFFLPESLRNDFEVQTLSEKQNEWILVVQEKKDRIPKELKEARNIVLNGFERKVEVITFPLQGKPLFLHFYRRKWKRQKEKKSYSNEYCFHLKGAKITPEFGAFLKETPRSKLSQYFRTFRGLRHIREEDIEMV